MAKRRRDRDRLTKEQHQPHWDHRRIWLRSSVGYLVLSIGLLIGLWKWLTWDNDRTPYWTAKIVARIPHDDQAFTQGLVFDRGELIEGTGKYGKSEVRRIELPTGKILSQTALTDDYFGEGLTVVGNLIVQLTWKRGTAFLYDRDTLKLVKQTPYSGQGWGITFDGEHLITSDGTSALKYRKPTDFKIVRTVQVSDGNWPVSRLNELEFIDGRIYANIWRKDRIAVIHSDTGQVEAWLDLKSLWPAHPTEAVLNGIAYDSKTKQLLVTGKHWPHLFQIEIIRP